MSYGTELAAHQRDRIEAALSCLASQDEDGYWAAVHVLRRAESIELALALADALRSGSSDERRLGADVLSQLGYPSGRPFLELALDQLTQASLRETDAEVVGAIVAALGHQSDVRALPAILIHLGHPDAEVRECVAAALGPTTEVPPTVLRDVVVPALAQLMGDPDVDVRNWATFALAGSPIDGFDVRDLLHGRLDDEDQDVRGEAIVGLAIRHDRRVLPVLAAQIDAAGTVDDLEYKVLDAIEAARASELLAGLRALRRRSPEDGGLDRAIANADPGVQETEVAALSGILHGVAAAGFDVALHADRFEPSFNEVVLDCGGFCFAVTHLLERHHGSVDSVVEHILEQLRR